MYICYKGKLHNKNLNSLLNLLINCIPVRFVPQILSIKCNFYFLLLNFLILGLCNFSANSPVAKSKKLLFEIFSFLIPLREVFLSKNL